MSSLYGLISHLSDSAAPLEKIRRDWENELGEGMGDDVWDSALAWVNYSSSCARLNLIQLKVVHRVYFTNSRLSEIYPNVEDSCYRCNLSPANMTHTFWSCPRLLDYWTTIFNHPVKAFDIPAEVTLCAEMAIFGILPNHPMIRRKTRECTAFALLIARRRIVLEWKSARAPKADVWLKDLMMFSNLEKIKYDLRGLYGKFENVWGPMIEYIMSLKTLQDSDIFKCMYNEHWPTPWVI